MERSFKDSGIPWIGKFPEHWEVCSLRKILRFLKGTIPKAFSDKKLDIPYLTMDYLRGKEDSSILYPIPNSSMVIMEESDLIVLWDGANAGEFILSKYGFLGSTMAKVVTDDNFFNSEYLFFFLKSLEPISKEFANGTTIPHFTPKFLYSYNYPIPPLSEQKEIATYLDKKCCEIDELIEVEQQMIFDLEAYRQAVISEVVTKGISQNMDFKFSGYDWIGYIPVNWDVKRLRFIGSTQNGISKEGSYFGSGSPFVNYGDVYNNIFLPKRPINLCKSDKTDQDIYSVKYGDVFFTRTSETIEEIGFSAACRETIDNAVFSGFLIRFRPDARILKPEYAGYYFRSKLHREFFVKEMNIVTRASLGQNLLRNIPVLIPPLEEQLEIADYLDAKCADIDELIKVKQEKIETLKQYRQSLIFEAVTGKYVIS